MTVIWMIAYLLSNVPDLFNGTGSDHAWLLMLALCILVDVAGWIASLTRRGDSDDV